MFNYSWSLHFSARVSWGNKDSNNDNSCLEHNSLRSGVHLSLRIRLFLIIRGITGVILQEWVTSCCQSGHSRAQGQVSWRQDPSEGDWERVAPPKTLRTETGQSQEITTHWILYSKYLPCYFYRDVSILGLSLQGKTKPWLDKGLSAYYYWKTITSLWLNEQHFSHKSWTVVTRFLGLGKLTEFLCIRGACGDW